MRFDPVYLVAPEPAKEPVRGFSRRALCASAFAALGGGFLLGRFISNAVSGNQSGPEVSVDESLAWALRLQDGPIADLLRSADGFLARVVAYGDRRLEKGMTRLIDETSLGESLRGVERSQMARKLESVIRMCDLSDDLRGRTSELQRVR